MILVEMAEAAVATEAIQLVLTRCSSVQRTFWFFCAFLYASLLHRRTKMRAAAEYNVR